jgi:hypothetical protein
MSKKYTKFYLAVIFLLVSQPSISESFQSKIKEIESLKSCTEARRNSTVALKNSAWSILEKTARSEIFLCADSPDDISSSYGSLLIALINQDKFQEVITEGSNCLKKAPSSPECHLHVAEAYLFVGNKNKHKFFISNFYLISQIKIKEYENLLNENLDSLPGSVGLRAETYRTQVEYYEAAIYKIKSMQTYAKKFKLMQE